MNGRVQNNILLVDNDDSYRKSLSRLLSLENFIVDEAKSVHEAVEKISTNHFDVILIDLRLTEENNAYDMSGLEVAKAAVEKHIPCIMITAYPTLEAARLALRTSRSDALALDFIPKNFGPQAILDAIFIIQKKLQMKDSVDSSKLEIDLDHRLVTLNNKVINLSSKQYILLGYLFQNQGIVCSTNELIGVVYRESGELVKGVDRRIEHLIDRLRRKIEEDPTNPQYIITVPGRGYRLLTERGKSE